MTASVKGTTLVTCHDEVTKKKSTLATADATTGSATTRDATRDATTEDVTTNDTTTHDVTTDDTTTNATVDITMMTAAKIPEIKENNHHNNQMNLESHKKEVEPRWHQVVDEIAKACPQHP